MNEISAYSVFDRCLHISHKGGELIEHAILTKLSQVVPKSCYPLEPNA